MREFRRPVDGVPGHYHIWAIDILGDTVHTKQKTMLNGKYREFLSENVKTYPGARTVSGVAQAQAAVIAAIRKKLNEGFIEITEKNKNDTLTPVDVEQALDPLEQVPEGFHITEPVSISKKQITLLESYIKPNEPRTHLIIYPWHRGIRLTCFKNAHGDIALHSRSSRNITENLRGPLLDSIERLPLPEKTLFTGVLYVKVRGKDDSNLAHAFVSGPRQREKIIFDPNYELGFAVYDILLWDGKDTVNDLTFRESRELHRNLFPPGDHPYVRMENRIELPPVQAMEEMEKVHRGIILYSENYIPKTTEFYQMFGYQTFHNSYIYVPEEREVLFMYFNPLMQGGGSCIKGTTNRMGSFAVYRLEKDALVLRGICMCAYRKNTEYLFSLARKNKGFFGFGIFRHRGLKEEKIEMEEAYLEQKGGGEQKTLPQFARTPLAHPKLLKIKEVKYPLFCKVNSLFPPWLGHLPENSEPGPDQVPPWISLPAALPGELRPHVKPG